MARWTPMKLVGGSYADDAKPWTQQDTINYIPVPAEKEGVRSSAILRGLPGYTTFCDLGTGAPIRGARNVEGGLFVVSAQTLFKIGPTGVATSLGTIPGASRCSLTHNQVAGGNQVVISNGQAGYVYNTATSTLSQITDDGFPGAICFDSVDSYILGIEPSRRFAFTSDLADATAYNTLDQYEAEGAPDLLVGQAVTHREWWLMGERTIEPFSNTGAATGTFQRLDGTVIEVGLAATHAVEVMDNSVFWLGNDGIVYRANGYTPQRISTHAIEQAIARCTLNKAFAFTFEDRGHKVFYLTFQDGHTWGYDAATGEWHRRKSHELDRWRINTLTKWNGRWIAGDFSNGKLYQLDWDVQHEDGLPLERRRITGVTHDNQNALIVNGLAVVVDTGAAAVPKWLIPLTITGNLPDGYVGQTITPYRYLASRGGPDRVFSIDPGALPDGLFLDSTGQVTGTITGASGTYAWTVRVNDADGSTATHNDSSLVTDQVWLASYQGASVNGVAAFGTPSGAWKPSTNAGEYGRVYKNGGSFYISRPSTINAVSVSIDQGVTWTDTGATGTISSGGGSMAFMDGFQYLCGGVNTIKRRSTGAWAGLSGSPSANSIVAHNGKLVTVYSTSAAASISGNDGVTWATGAGSFQGSGIGNPQLASNGQRLVVLYNGGAGVSYAMGLKYSDDDGQSWSALAYTFPSPADSNLPADLIFTGSGWVACTSTGQVAYSADGATWTLSASTIGLCNQLAAGSGKVLAACNGGLIYASSDGGATWASIAAPSDNNGLAISGVAWVF